MKNLLAVFSVIAVSLLVYPFENEGNWAESGVAFDQVNTSSVMGIDPSMVEGFVDVLTTVVDQAFLSSGDIDAANEITFFDPSQISNSEFSVAAN